jgi:hypothetical protein
MNPESRTCQNCHNDFTIEADDFSFYEKIKVPPPTFCPECRMIRRMIWRNVRSLYKRPCGICGVTLISMYADTDTVPVYCSDCWNGDKWDPFMYAKEYDFSQPFFVQLKELFNTVPRFYAYKFGLLVNSDFTNFSKDNKNAYLSYSVTDCEDIMYSEVIDKSRNTIDSYAVQKTDGCSYNIDCDGNYNSHYAIKSQTCIDSYFIYDCTNCQNCCLSWNLRNQQYVFRNQKLSKEEYQEEVKNLHLETYSGFDAAKKEFDKIIKNNAIHKYAFIYSSQNVTGDYINNSKNAKRCFDTTDSENVAYGMRAIVTKDCYDVQGVGFNAELIYESMAATANTSKDSFCYLTIQGCRECEYSLILKNCTHCFGCVGLTNAQYCIFNKQYTKEEYEELLPKIKQHMDDMPYVDQKGRIFRYGEFFPYDMCPFGYNESNAHDFFPLTKEECLANCFNWKDKVKKEYNITIQSSELPDNIDDVEDSIINEVISCPSQGNLATLCATAYRITPIELQFYKQRKLPLPRFCPNCRHYDRLQYRNQVRLYTRSCSKGCGNLFQTTYTPDRPEKVYCESCYQAEVL